VWTLEDRIGFGGFGTVYDAICANRRMAIKLVPKIYNARRELLLARVLHGVPGIFLLKELGKR